MILRRHSKEITFSSRGRYAYERTSVGNICCSNENKYLPAFFIEQMWFRADDNLFYSKHISTNFFHSRAIRGLITSLNADNLMMQFKYPGTVINYYAGNHFLFTIEDGKMNVLMTLALETRKIPDISSVMKAEEFVLLVDKNIQNHKKLLTYIKKSYFPMLEELGIDIIMTTHLEKYCFTPIQHKRKFATLDDLFQIGAAVKVDIYKAVFGRDRNTSSREERARKALGELRNRQELEIIDDTVTATSQTVLTSTEVRVNASFDTEATVGATATSGVFLVNEDDFLDLEAHDHGQD